MQVLEGRDCTCDLGVSREKLFTQSRKGRKGRKEDKKTLASLAVLATLIGLLRLSLFFPKFFCSLRPLRLCVKKILL
jgi:hypothetical protein